MFSKVPQFVPQKVCLSCDGCCRFKEENSSWRPKITKEEVATARRAVSTLTGKIFSKEWVDVEGHIKAVKDGGACHCAFFNAQENTCGIYAQHPFDCQLYPFLLARKGEKIFISVHLNCPFIQENKDNNSFEEFVGVLKKYFEDEDVKSFLKNNPLLATDYSEYENELKYIFKVF